MWKTRLIAAVLLIVGVLIGLWVYSGAQGEKHNFHLGLDLSGGSYLVYKTDTSLIEKGEIADSLQALRDVIERRINLFGVAEPRVQIEKHKEEEHRLVIELPGVTNVDDAIEMIGQTPLLEFKTEVKNFEKLAKEQQTAVANAVLGEDGTLKLQIQDDNLKHIEDLYEDTGLTGRFLEKATLQFDQSNVGVRAGQAIVAISFNDEGAELFEKITSENVGKTVAIFLDGVIISNPVVNTTISGGDAVIEGNFTPEEAKELVGRLNSGALPIPIELLSVNTVGPSLGQDAVDAGVYAAIVGFILVSLILILWYRLPGLIAVVALGIYGTIMLAIFQFIPVTLTSAGIAGFVISLGIAVDANILIFERMKEEIRAGQSLYESINIGFKRAWSSIRDANISSIISAVILFWFGSSLIEGFALTFGFGIIVSMLTAITVTKFFLLIFAKKEVEVIGTFQRFLYGTGLSKK